MRKSHCSGCGHTGHNIRTCAHHIKSSNSKKKRAKRSKG